MSNLKSVIGKELSEYQIKKLQRRGKQRSPNIGRAEKMRKARISGKFNPDLFFASKETDSKLNIGCSGWFYWDWKGSFYPENLPTNSWFDYYSNNFKTVELNAPFYSWPLLSTVKGWIKQAQNKDFIYTVKVCELITHIKRFQNTKTLIKDFGLIADLLGLLMGCFLFKFPPSFHYTKARLKNILNQLDSSRRNVVEFRHDLWWREEVYKAFKEYGVIFCSCSGPKLPEQLIKTSEENYVRFHGTSRWYRHDYTKEELNK